MIEIKPINPTKAELKRYVNFGIDMYQGNDCYVPPLVVDELHTLMPSKNPAFDFCEAQSFMAYRDGEPVGRITAIINRNVNAKNGEKKVRFGFVDFIDDAEVVDALFGAVAAWGKERGMTRMVGPMGFSDMDHEGMLTFGFEEMGTMATIYNYPYYPKHMERMGFESEANYVEYRIKVPETNPDKIARVSRIVEQRFGLRMLKFKSRKDLKENWGHAAFELINECYAPLYGYSALTPRQIDYYIDMYLGILHLDNICAIADENDRLVCIGISMPSLSKALRKSKGKLFPMGWWHLLRALNGADDVVDLLLVAVKPEFQNKGVNALLFNHLIPTFNQHGYKAAESNLELEDNESVQRQWEMFERRLHRRRRIYGKDI